MRPLALVLLLAALPARAAEQRPAPRARGAQVRLLGWTTDSKYAVFSVDRHPQPGRAATAPRLVVLDREGAHVQALDDDQCPKDAPPSADCVETKRGGKAAWLQKHPLAPAADPVPFTRTLQMGSAAATLAEDAAGCTLQVTRGAIAGPLFSGPCPTASTLQFVDSPDRKSTAAAWTVFWPDPAKCPGNEPCAPFDGHFGVVTKRAVTPVALLLPDGTAWEPNALAVESQLRDRGWLQVTVGDLKDPHESTEIFAKKGYESLAEELAAALGTDLADGLNGHSFVDVPVKPLTWKSPQPLVIAVAGEGHGRGAKK